MCLAARRRISLLMKFDHSDAMIAALNKLLSFHLTLSKYDINKSLHLRFIIRINIERLNFLFYI